MADHNAQLLAAYKIACRNLGNILSTTYAHSLTNNIGQQLCEGSLQYTGDSTVIYCVVPVFAPGSRSGGTGEDITPIDIAECLAEILKLTHTQPHLNIAIQVPQLCQPPSPNFSFFES